MASQFWQMENAPSLYCQLLLTYIRFLSTTLFTLIALCSLYSMQTTTGKKKKKQRLFVTNDKQKSKVESLFQKLWVGESL